MATRLYFSSNRASDISPSFSADWILTSGAVRRHLSIGKGNSPLAEGTVQSWSGYNNTNTLQYILDRQYISGPLAAQTISLFHEGIQLLTYFTGTNGTVIPGGSLISMASMPDAIFYVSRDVTLLTATDWLTYHIYAVGDVVTSNGNIYICTTAGESYYTQPTTTAPYTRETYTTLVWSYIGPGTAYATEYVLNRDPGVPVRVPPYTLNVINTSVTGWQGTNNANLPTQYSSTASIYNTITGMINVREYDVAGNVSTIFITMYIVDSDGEVTGTLIDFDFDDSGDEFNATQYQARNFFFRSHPPYDYGKTFDRSVAVDEGDRLVIEIGYVDWNLGTNPSASAMWGETGTDLPFLEDDIDPPSTTVGVPWIEFSNDIEFLDHPELSASITGETNISIGLQVLSDTVHYKIYHSVDPRGPWVEDTIAPIIDKPDGNSFEIQNLTNGTVYYIMVVGGRYNEDREFVPICGQTISPNPESGADVSNPNMVQIRPKRVSSTATATLGMTVYTQAIGSI